MPQFNAPATPLSYGTTLIAGQKVRGIPASWVNAPNAWTPFYQGPPITPGQVPTFPGGALTMRLGPAGPLLGASPLPGSSYLATSVGTAAGAYGGSGIGAYAGGTGGGPQIAPPPGNPWDPRTSPVPWAVASLTVGLLMLRFVVHL